MGQPEDDKMCIVKAWDLLLRKNLFMKVCCGKSKATMDEMRKLLMQQLFIFTFLNTCTMGFKFILKMQHNEAEKNAIIISVALVWSMVPFGVYSLYYHNKGVLSFYIMYGVFVGAAKIAYLVISVTMVAVSCQYEQRAFKGCDAWGDVCLLYSNCSRDMIQEYNSGVSVSCDAWATEDCSAAPPTQDTMGFSALRIILLVFDILTAYVPIYLAFLYLMRAENIDAGLAKPTEPKETTGLLSNTPKDTDC